MTRRAVFQAQLTAAASRRGVTLVMGLPRVGRTTLLDDWLKHHPEARKCEKVSEVGGGGEVFLLDHIAGDAVEQIVDAARMLDAAKDPACLFVVPIDLKTAAQIQQKLTGMVATVELAPLQPLDSTGSMSDLSQATGPDLRVSITSAPTNVAPTDPDRHWLRGGFPKSLYADSDMQSIEWRRAMLKALLERDYTDWDVLRSYPLGDVLRCLANQNGGEFDDNAVPFGKRAEFKSAVHVLEKLGLVRRLFNFPAGSNESLGKKPKLYVRDSGILHAVLGIRTTTELRSHKDVGTSFESYAMEALISAGGEDCSPHFYRANGDAGENEIDLLLSFPYQGNRLVAIEFKVGTDQRPRRGFYVACGAINFSDRFVVHSGHQPDLNCEVQRLDLTTAIGRITEIASL